VWVWVGRRWMWMMDVDVKEEMEVSHCLLQPMIVASTRVDDEGFQR